MPPLHIERHEELDSTNNRAAQLAANPIVSLPAVIVADRQTAGRGRGANAWWSHEGALTFSLLIDANAERLPAARWPLVSLAAAIVVADVLAEDLPGRDVQLKWPNDVFVDGRKICGILTEAPPIRPARLIVGIGVNVNNSLAAAPEEVRARATSCIDETGQPHDREGILQDIVQYLLNGIDEVAAGRFPLVMHWSSRCFLTGKQIAVEVHGRTIQGDCGGIDDDGALLVSTPAGIERLFAGVVKCWD